jgi:hypothetical protein
LQDLQVILIVRNFRNYVVLAPALMDAGALVNALKVFANAMMVIQE